jgi:hypothetical protein
MVGRVRQVSMMVYSAVLSVRESVGGPVVEATLELSFLVGIVQVCQGTADEARRLTWFRIQRMM